MKRLSFITTLLLLIIVTGSQAQTVAELIDSGDTTAAAKLIKQGADPNAIDNNGSTAMMTAARWGKADQVVFLLKHGAKVDEPRSAKGRTPLMVGCAYYSGITVCKILLDAGADINAKTTDGTTALMLAANMAKIDVVEYLLSRGADPNLTDGTGKNALQYAITAYVSEAKDIKNYKIDKDATIERLKLATK